MNEIRIEQSIAGMQLPTEPECRECRGRLTEGRPISVVVEFPHDMNERWRFAAAYCPTDAPETIDPSTAAHRALVEGEVAEIVDVNRQSHWPVVIRPTVVESHTKHSRAVAGP